MPEQKITVEEALRCYTVNNAYAVYAEGNRGRLHQGYLADLVVIDRDLTRIPPTSIDQAKVVVTIVNGKVVFEGPGARDEGPGR